MTEEMRELMIHLAEVALADAATDKEREELLALLNFLRNQN